MSDSTTIIMRRRPGRTAYMLRLTPELLARMKQAAADRNMSAAAWLEQAVLEACQEQEKGDQRWVATGPACG